MKEEKRSHPSSARRRPNPVIVGGVLLLLLVGIRAQAWQAVGFVVEKQGTWQLEKGPNLVEGARVTAGGHLTNPFPADGDHITVVDLTGELIVKLRCQDKKCFACLRDSDSCLNPVPVLPEAKQTSGTLSTVIYSVMELVTGKPDRYSVHRVRGQALTDAVVRMDQGRIDLAPVFAGHEKGRYKVRLAAVAAESGGRTWKSDPVSVDWDPARGGIAAVSGLERGLYSLVLLEADGSEGTPMDTWVLVTNPGEYPKVASAFKDVSDQTAKWGTSVRRDTAQRFLRASLDYLSRQQAAEPAKDGKQ